MSEMLNRAERIKSRRIEIEMTQNELAQQLGVTPQAVSAIERGVVKRLTNVSKLSRILGVSSSWILFGVESEKVKNLIDDIKIPCFTFEKLEKADNIYRELNQYKLILKNSATINEREYMLFHGTEQQINMVGIIVSAKDSTFNPLDSKMSLNEGDILVIDLDKEPENEDIVVCKDKKSSQILIKTFMKNGEVSYFKSINPKYPIITDNLEILGVGVELRRSLKNK